MPDSKDHMTKTAVKNKEFICRSNLIERIQDMWYACDAAINNSIDVETKQRTDFLRGIGDGLYEIRKKFLVSSESIEQYKATENIAVGDAKKELEKLGKEWDGELKHAEAIMDSYSASSFSGKIEAIKRVREQLEALRKARSCP